MPNDDSKLKTLDELMALVLQAEQAYLVPYRRLETLGTELFLLDAWLV